MEFNAEDNNNFSTYRPPPIPPAPQHKEQELPTVNDINTQPPTQVEQRGGSLDRDQPRQYTQYTESVFLSRPTPPNNSLILNSMMADSSVLAPPSSSPSSTSLAPSSNPAPSSLVKDSILQHEHERDHESTNENEASMYTSSIYYDASSSTSFIHNAVIEGAFEPSSVDPK